MIEENEVRAALDIISAKVAAGATELGNFETKKKALLSFFESASQAKRSSFRKFSALYCALDEPLKYPNETEERLEFHHRIGMHEARHCRLI